MQIELNFDEFEGIDQPLEAAVAGLIYNQKNGIGRFPRVRPLHFTNPEIRLWFETAHELANAGRNVDIMEAYALLKDKGRGKAVNIADFTEILTSPEVFQFKSAKPETVEKRLVRLWQRRETIKLGTDMAKGLVDVAQMQIRVSEISNEGADNGREKIADVAIRVLQQAERALNARRNNEPLPDAVYPGIREVDMLGGYRTGDLVIIAGRPGMGKSTFARWIARMVSYRFPALFLTEEMTKEQAVSLMACSLAKLDQRRVRNMDLDDVEYSRYVRAVSDASNLDIELDYLDELFSLVAKLRAWRMQTGSPEKPAVVFIDYLQQIQVDNSELNRVQKIGLVSTILKQLAKQLNIVIIGLAQLSRAVEQRGGDKRPILSDLRDSGELEQDADIVIFCYRPEYYGFETDDEGSSTLHLCEFIHAKNRHGPTGTAKFYFDMASGSYIDPTDFFADKGRKEYGVIPGGYQVKRLGPNSAQIKLPGDYEKDDDFGPPKSDEWTPF